MSTVSIFARVVATPDQVAFVGQACLAIVDSASQEDGCLAYHLLAGEEAGVFAWFERWRDQAAFERHLAGAAASQLGAALEGRTEGPMELQTFVDLA